MINRKHRFHGRSSLRFVYQKGNTVRGALGTLKYVRNPRRTEYRMAVVVSRKVHKSAVVRNRIRRRIYEVVRMREKDITGPYDLVFSVFSDQVADMPTDELRERTYLRMRQAGVLPPLPGESASTKPDAHGIVNNKELPITDV